MARQTILFKELLLEIGYIEQMRTTRGNKEVPQTLFDYTFCPQKYFQSVRLRTIGNPAFRNFVTL